MNYSSALKFDRRPRGLRGVARALLLLLLVAGSLVVAGPPANALGDNYPWPNANMNQFSPLGFAYRNCTDYAAWTINTQLGGSTSDIRFRWSDIQSGGSGHARDWRQGAISRGKAVDQAPARGSVAWWGANFGGGYGHVAVVAEVRDGGNTVVVHEYNANWNGTFGTRTLYRGQTSWPQDFLHIADIPEPPSDPDGDGFVAPADRCPNTWGKQDGCPIKADFSNDGRSEVASFYRYDGNLINLWLWNGQSNRYTSEPYVPWSATGWDATRVIPAGNGKFNADPYQDTAAFYRHDGGMVDLNIWYGNTNGGLSQSRAWHVATSWEGDRLIPVGGGDFNTDGIMDIAAFYRYDGNFVSLYVWYGQAGYTVSQPVTVWTGTGWDGTRIIPVGIHDVDGDGKLDIATFYRHDGGMVDYNVWYGAGNGSFGLGRTWHTPNGWDASRFVPAGMADLDSDGRGDAIVFYRHDGNLVDMRVWWGTASRLTGEPGGPWSASGWDGARIIPAGTGDYDGDGKADVATFYRHDGQMVDLNIWYGNGAGALTPHRAWHIPTAWEGARLVPAKG